MPGVSAWEQLPRCSGLTTQAQPWRAPRNRDRPKPCQRAVAFTLQDTDEIRAAVSSCQAHLGGLVATLAARYGAVKVEPVKAEARR